MAECILKCGYLYTGVLHSNENEWIRLNDINMYGSHKCNLEYKKQIV